MDLPADVFLRIIDHLHPREFEIMRKFCTTTKKQHLDQIRKLLHYDHFSRNLDVDDARESYEKLIAARGALGSLANLDVSVVHSIRFTPDYQIMIIREERRGQCRATLYDLSSGEAVYLWSRDRVHLVEVYAEGVITYAIERQFEIYDFDGHLKEESSRTVTPFGVGLPNPWWTTETRSHCLCPIAKSLGFDSAAVVDAFLRYPLSKAPRVSFSSDGAFAVFCEDVDPAVRFTLSVMTMKGDIVHVNNRETFTGYVRALAVSPDSERIFLYTPQAVKIWRISKMQDPPLNFDIRSALRDNNEYI